MRVLILAAVLLSGCVYPRYIETEMTCTQGEHGPEVKVRTVHEDNANIILYALKSVYQPIADLF